MLISVSVLMTLAARDLTSSLNSASGQAVRMTRQSVIGFPSPMKAQRHMPEVGEPVLVSHTHADTILG